ncbi:MAG: hypothetical protein DSM107014_08585 [Gomphosphaeria aponina SAG 52.96 = DSM 107014]|uniref:Uncharacterized protein n=1 Tax=Gomphosphaeria aponina SAG 52.96 = DSM 107014 TaxID=1521640 RepID=A0A941GR03_9CHRO|nr:hypothetical protein [Gomphosphaeria aponina SAG 52.96 = DSM 107014]
MKIDWEKIAEIKELKPFFANDFTKFKSKIEAHLEKWQQISSEDLDKLALLRALEVTNGCTQWAYRLKKPDCLSIEQTRECMQISMSSIKNKKINLTNNSCITFTPEINNLIDEGRQLYIDAFKNQIEGKDEDFYALSTAQFLVYGKARMAKAFAIIRDNYLISFTEHFIKKGINYIEPYMRALNE